MFGDNPGTRLGSATDVRATPLVLTRTSAVAVAATFFVMGVLVALYGPLLEHLTRRFGVSLAVAGAVISVHYGGGLLGVLAAIEALRRRDVRVSVVGGLVLAAAGCVGVAVAPAWPVLLAAVFVLGVGFGGLVIALNQLVAYSAGPRRAALLNALNAAYSGGAVIGPVAVAAFAASHFTAMYLAFAGVAVVLVAAAARVPGRLPRTQGGSIRPGPLVTAFIVAFVFYVAIETGTGGWMTSHLESHGMASTTAATLTSAFWLALFGGRLLVALVPADVADRVVVLAAAGATTLFLLGTAIPAAAPIAYLAAGAAMAPIFPTAIVWLARLRPDDSRATAWLFPATSLGGIAGPGAIGVVVGMFGVAWVPVVLGLVALAMTASFVLANRIARR